MILASTCAHRFQALKDYEAKAQVFNKREGLFDVAPTEYDQLGKIVKEFEPYASLWLTANDWHKWQREWLDGSLNALVHLPSVPLPWLLLPSLPQLCHSSIPAFATPRTHPLSFQALPSSLHLSPLLSISKSPLLPPCASHGCDSQVNCMRHLASATPAFSLRSSPIV